MAKTKPDTAAEVEVTETDIPELAPAEGVNAHGIGPDTDGGPNPDYQPDTPDDPDADVPGDGDPLADPGAADPDTDATGGGDPLADPAENAPDFAQIDAARLPRLLEAVAARNTDAHREALWAELERDHGASLENGRLFLAGVSGAGTGTAKSLLDNWANAARRKLMELGNV
jgi:hypothetical protein